MLLEVVIPGAQGRVLAALLRLDGPRTISELARLAGVSRDRAADITAELERARLVTREHVGRALLVSVVDENPVIESLRDIEDARERAISKLRHAADAMIPQPRYMAIYGSWARGAERDDSDLDIAVIVGEGVDHDRLHASLDDWSGYAQRVTGRVPSIVIADTTRDAAGPLWESVRRDEIVLVDHRQTGSEHRAS